MALGADDCSVQVDGDFSKPKSIKPFCDQFRVKFYKGFKRIRCKLLQGRGYFRPMRDPGQTNNTTKKGIIFEVIQVSETLRTDEQGN